ncbi:MAG: hypothetical protein DMF50_04580 [Acidobacteria bacterium]|nr:MAG: hypothetical protein DMF50_04580 [Acidobacteriota bacterium]
MPRAAVSASSTLALASGISGTRPPAALAISTRSWDLRARSMASQAGRKPRARSARSLSFPLSRRAALERSDSRDARSSGATAARAASSALVAAATALLSL